MFFQRINFVEEPLLRVVGGGWFPSLQAGGSALSCSCVFGEGCP